MWNAFKILNLLYLLISTNVWFGWVGSKFFITLVMVAALLVLLLTGGFRLRITPRLLVICAVLVLYVVYQILILDVFSGLLVLALYLPGVMLFMLDEELQDSLLVFVTKWICIIMGVSLGLFLIHFVVPLPHFSFLPGMLSDSYEGFDNYIFFMVNVVDNVYMSSVTRFCGPFLEPGHQSMLCCFLLFANRFDFRANKLLWILLVSVLASLSLAGYVILFVGFLLIKLRNLYSLVPLVFLTVGSWLFVTEVWDGGQNPLNLMIVQRLEYDKDKGIAGNNRTAKVTDFYYEKCVEDGTIWLGVRGSKRALDRILGAGYKIFLLRYGVVAAAFTLAIYLLLIPSGVNKRYVVSFLFIIFLTFLQRAYPDWYAWLLPYVLGIGVSRHFHSNGNGGGMHLLGDGAGHDEEEMEMGVDGNLI